MTRNVRMARARAPMSHSAPVMTSSRPVSLADRKIRYLTAETRATRGIHLLYAPSLYVRERRHTIARQTWQEGQDKRLRPSAQLELAHRVSAQRHGAVFSTTAIAARSTFDRASPTASARAHIHHPRWRRWNAAQSRAAAVAPRAQVARDPRGRRDHARWPLGAHAPRRLGWWRWCLGEPGRSGRTQRGSAQTRVRSQR